MSTVMWTSCRPVLLKKVKVLDQENIKLKGERDILVKQIELLKLQSTDELNHQNQLLEEALAQVSCFIQ